MIKKEGIKKISTFEINIQKDRERKTNKRKDRKRKTNKRRIKFTKKKENCTVGLRTPDVC